MAELAIARPDELPAGTTKKFVLRCGGREVECFVLNAGGTFHAYVNQCQHVPMGLDWVENQFFTADGQYVQCATHGAYYVPDTGECIAGPPCGRSLVRVPLALRDAVLWARCPDAIPD
ncbi:MAG: Rieske 2Fe-2S domain-containing protein [bacterium]|nr:Rieske 2Fe-2S domain-containing protein [bacterium]